MQTGKAEVSLHKCAFLPELLLFAEHNIQDQKKAGLGSSGGCVLDWRSGGREFATPVWYHSFVEIDHEIFSTVILSLPLIQEGKLSVTCEILCTGYWLTT